MRAAAVAGVAFMLAPLLAATTPVAGAPAPLASSPEKIAFLDDFSTGGLDPEKWVLPSPWAVERTRLRPWDFPQLALNDSTFFRASDSLYPAPGRYADGTKSVLESAWIDLTPASAGARMQLYARYDIDSLEDGGLVYARTEALGWAVITPTGGYPTQDGFAGYTATDTLAQFDLSLYAGSRLKLAFQTVSGDNGLTGDGWQIRSLVVSYTATVPQPDLAASEVQVFSSVGSRITAGTAGDLLELRANVLNTGTATATASVAVFFWDGPAQTGRFIGQAILPPVAVGASGLAALRVVLAAGNHTLTAVVDPGAVLTELSTANNEAHLDIQLDPPPGVDPAVLDVAYLVAGQRSSGARPGQVVTASLTYGNLGTNAYSAGYILGVYLRISPNSTAALAESTRVGLASSDVRTATFNFTLNAGNLTLVASITPQGAISEASTANNAIERPFTVTDSPPVDLVVALLEIYSGGVPSSSVSEGEVVQLRATLRNAGTQDYNGSFAVAFFVGDPDAGGQLLILKTVADGLAGGSTTEIRGSWSALVGQRTLYAYVDWRREVFEADELDNKAQAALQVNPDTRPNLVIDEVSFNVLGNEVNATQVGAPVVIEARVRNIGSNGTVHGVLTASSANPWVTANPPGQLQANLPQNFAKNTVATLTLNWTAQTGAHVFYFVVDQGLSTGETNEFDNIAVRTLSVSADSPDLSVLSVSVKSKGIETSALYRGLNVTLTAEVSNIGVSPVNSSFDIEVWAGEPGSLDAVRLRSLRIAAPFEAGDTARVSFSWLAAFPSNGEAQIVAVADPARAIIEADTTNNRGAKAVTYLGNRLPNLHIEQFTASAGGFVVSQAKEGATLVLSVTIRNDQPAPHLGGGVVEIRDGEQVLLTRTLGRIEPQGSETLSANWTARPGAHVVVTLDSLSAVSETDEGDNVQEISLTVSEAPRTPWALYAGIGVGAAALAGLLLLLLLLVVRRRRASAEERLAPAPESGATPEAPPPPELYVPPPPPGFEPPEVPPPFAPEEAPAAAFETPAPGPETAPFSASAVLATCPKCGEPTEPGWTLCPNCETPLA